ncbi:aspartate-alanine antiporter, partial [Streptomyces sp. NPDC059956]
MIDFLNRNIFQPHPELLVFITVALGFLVGKLRWKAIGLGAVTGCLIVGLVFGAQFKITIDGTVKNLFFTMFLFALGYKVGPQFFRGLKKDGLPQVLNA